MTTQLPSFLPIPVSIVAVLAATIFYFWIEPRLHKRIPIFSEIPFKPFTGFTFRRFVDMSILIVMTTLALILLSSPSLKSPTSWSNLLYDLFMARANGDDSAHVATYIVMPALFFWVWHFEKDSCKAFLYVLFMAFAHEVIWFLFYYAAYWNDIVSFALLWQRDVSFIIFLSGFGLVWWFKYKQFNRVLIVGLIGLFILNIVWLSIGFPITNVTAFNYAPSMAITPTGQTAWFNVLWVNQIEVGYWWYALAIFMAAEYYQIKGKVRKVLL